MDKNQKLYDLRHSAAHLLAQAVLELYPNTKPTIGPVTEHGFFYDFLPTQNFKEEDLALIEVRMHELVKKNYAITGRAVPKPEARTIYKDNPFKLEIIDGIPEETVGIYSQGPFFDLCRGGHVETLGEIKHFKLTGISGSYWRADKSGTALQRISGVAFLSQEELDNYLKALEDAKLYDHRRLGKQLDLFSFHEEAPGSAFFHPKGLTVYNALIDYSRSLQKEDYQEIKTPLIMHENLWKTSGHYDNYKNNMYFIQIDEQFHCVRPMNCPSSIMLYKEKPHSYRELPLRISEYGLVHRYELSGVLHGLFRVRSFTQDDAHIYVTVEQIEQEVIKVLHLADTLYRRFGFTKIEMALSTRPEKSSMGSEELWSSATTALANALKHCGYAYEIQAGEGAFYGPKIEIRIEDVMGRKWQCGTVQVDFFLPQNFELEYIDSDQSRKTPVIIHRAIYGSIERFFGMMLEHFKGRLPFWIAPIQVRVLPITDLQRPYAQELKEKLQARNFRIEIDESQDQLGAQIRRAQLDKIPCMLVLGKKEQENKTVTLRSGDGAAQQQGITFETLCEILATLQAA